MHFNVKKPALRFASFEADMRQSCGFQANEASDVIDHVLLANRIKLLYSASMWDVLFFWYKLRSLGVERHITRWYTDWAFFIFAGRDESEKS